MKVIFPVPQRRQTPGTRSRRITTRDSGLPPWTTPSAFDGTDACQRHDHENLVAQGQPGIERHGRDPGEAHGDPLGAHPRRAGRAFAEAGLSANAIAERVRRLISARVIRGFHADLDLAALGYRLFAFVDIKTGAKAGIDTLEAALAELPQVQRATWTTGNFDFTLEVACRDQEDLVRLIEKLRERVPISETYTRVIGRELFRAKSSLPELGH